MSSCRHHYIVIVIRASRISGLGSMVLSDWKRLAVSGYDICATVKHLIMFQRHSLTYVRSSVVVFFVTNKPELGHWLTSK